MHEYPRCESATLLAKFHWHIVRGERLIDSASAISRSIEKDGFTFTERDLTEFGRQVNRDPVHWWVFWRCSNVSDLRARTMEALEAAQKLREHILKLRISFINWPSIIQSISRFTETWKHEIATLISYVEYLASFDPMATGILFTQRVWGSTERHWRHVSCEKNHFHEESDNVVRLLIEAVYGLQFYQAIHVLDEKLAGLSYEIYESMQNEPDAYTTNEPIQSSQEKALGLAAIDIHGRMVTYFKEIRDSLRAVLDEIDKYEHPDCLVSSQQFWRDMVCKCTVTPTAEPELWDIKETLEMFHIREGHAKQKASIKFAEEIASFANNKGGALIIGITDNPRTIVGLPKEQLEDKISHIDNAIKKFIKPQFGSYSVRQVPILLNSQIKICLVVVVPQTKNALYVEHENNLYSYPVRLSTGTGRTSLGEISERKRMIDSDNFHYINQLREFVSRR